MVERFFPGTFSLWTVVIGHWANIRFTCIKKHNMKRIIIIGASSGIGKEMALLYAKQGNKVGITGRRNHLLQEIKNQFPANIFTSCFDVTGNENQKHVQQ